jgi:cold shock CspA family protein
MPLGRIKKLIADKRFGFIALPGRRDVFFHALSVQDVGFEDLQAGQTVEFEMQAADTPNGKGPRARIVRPLSEIASALDEMLGH